MEAAIQTLSAMGISRAHAVRGIEATRTGGQVNLQRAVNWCLSNPASLTPQANSGSSSISVRQKGVQELMGMGFTRGHAEKALRLKKNNVHEAAMWCAMNPDTGGSARPSSKPSKSEGKSSSTRKPKPVDPLQALELKEDTPEKRAKRMREYKALEKEFLSEQEKLKSKMAHSSSSGSGKADMDVEETKSKDVMTAIKHKHELEKQKEIRRQMEARKKAEQKKQTELAARTAKRKELESKIGGFDAALKHLFDNYGIERVKETLNLILKICNKILKKPSEPKIRRIKLSSKLVQRALVRPLGAMVVMRALGFEEGLEYVEMKKVDQNTIRRLLQKIERSLGRGATQIPSIFAGAEAKGVLPEIILFGAGELRRILGAIAELPGSVQLRSMSTEKGELYSMRFAPYPQLQDALKFVGFEKDDTSRFIRLTKPDLALIRAAITDLESEIATRAPKTRVATAVGQLLHKFGKEKTVFIVEKARVALGRIQRVPSEKRYWTLDLKRLLAKHPESLSLSKILFTGLGFNVDGDNATWNGFDTSGLGLAMQHLNQVWKGALIAASRKA